MDSIELNINDYHYDAHSLHHHDKVMVKRIMVKNKAYWIGTDSPILYDYNTYTKVGFIHPDFSIEWFTH